MANPPDSDAVFLTTRQLGALILKSTITLEEWRREGRGPAYVKLGAGRGARILYRRSDVDAWLQAQTRGGSETPAAAAAP
jgi:helix-turn-helix protein